MRDIKGFEGLYAITSCGKVWSYRSKKFLALYQTKSGYLTANLSKNGKSKPYRVNRLVAEAYLENPNNLPYVNHKDEVKTHNWINNLEWCDAKYNNNYGSHSKRVAEGYLNGGKNCYKVKQFSLEGEYIATYRSMREAERLNNLANGSLSAYFKNHYSQWGGYKWERA